VAPSCVLVVVLSLRQVTVRRLVEDDATLLEEGLTDLLELIMRGGRRLVGGMLSGSTMLIEKNVGIYRFLFE
jgi:hypothetical protein